MTQLKRHSGRASSISISPPAGPLNGLLVVLELGTLRIGFFNPIALDVEVVDGYLVWTELAQHVGARQMQVRGVELSQCDQPRPVENRRLPSVELDQRLAAQTL
jgi:hypothetical protein